MWPWPAASLVALARLETDNFHAGAGATRSPAPCILATPRHLLYPAQPGALLDPRPWCCTAPV